MVDYDVLKALTITSLLWLLFFLNLILSKSITGEYVVDIIMWSGLYMLILISSLVSTLVVIAESIKNYKKSKLNN